MTDATINARKPTYSPSLRTALVLNGTGTAGAYHAGVLQALNEAGVRIDLVAGRGVGAVSAMFAAVDGGAKLWEEKGIWRGGLTRQFYRWRPILRVAGYLFGTAVATILLPLVLLVGAALGYPIVLSLQMIEGGAGGALLDGYSEQLLAMFDSMSLPTIFPWLVVFLLLLLLAVVSSLGMGYLFSAMNVKYRDFSYIIPFIIQNP